MWHLDFVHRHVHRSSTFTLILIDDHSRYVVGHGVDEVERADMVENSGRRLRALRRLRPAATACAPGPHGDQRDPRSPRRPAAQAAPGRSPDETALRESFETFFPGAQCVRVSRTEEIEDARLGRRQRGGLRRSGSPQIGSPYLAFTRSASSPSILPEMSSGSCSRLAGTGEVHRLLPKSPAAVTGKPPASSRPPLAMRAGVPLVPPR